ncbi:MAG: hypothetical protein IPJ21_03325 [Sterolibacteriaceae bacterium]|nr:hypothetical protein [Sterolibacteriaceae bacterium]MBK9086687.1 hypothetical protein [Sterolibacteriaceae bacterium]
MKYDIGDLQGQSMLDDVFETIEVEPREGRETQLMYWFRVCVAEWSNGVSPRLGVTEEELLIWDKGRQRHILETHRYGRELPHQCERTALTHDAIRVWVGHRGRAIVWRADAQSFYPAFVHPRPTSARRNRAAA